MLAAQAASDVSAAPAQAQFDRDLTGGHVAGHHRHKHRRHPAGSLAVQNFGLLRNRRHTPAARVDHSRDPLRVVRAEVQPGVFNRQSCGCHPQLGKTSHASRRLRLHVIARLKFRNVGPRSGLSVRHRSSSGTRRAPDRPCLSESQNASTPTPIGVTGPIPVITIRSSGGRSDGRMRPFTRRNASTARRRCVRPGLPRTRAPHRCAAHALRWGSHQCPVPGRESRSSASAARSPP